MSNLIREESKHTAAPGDTGAPEAQKNIEPHSVSGKMPNDAMQHSVGAISPTKVFVVHGHDKVILNPIARFLERLGLEPIFLSQQPQAGRTIIEKFADFAPAVGFAVVVLTPSDLGGPAAVPAQAARARQNVIFELGYFAKLGRGRACLLRKGEVEIPSDLYGVVYTDMDAAEGWKRKLARDLKAAGFGFDPLLLAETTSPRVSIEVPREPATAAVATDSVEGDDAIVDLFADLGTENIDDGAAYDSATLTLRQTADNLQEIVTERRNLLANLALMERRIDRTQQETARILGGSIKG
jgi:predicted nucleotide-binding protein